MSNYSQDNFTGKNHEGAHVNTPVRVLTASSVIGDEVFNREGDKLGKVKDIMLDINEGKIEYIIIEFGGFLGLGEKYFAIPFRGLELDTTRHGFIFNQSKEVLENAPGFDKDHWPKTNDHSFENSSAYWGGFMGPNTGSVPY